MFGFCIWAELTQPHIFYNINRLLVSKSNSQKHNPHITLEYDVNLKNQTIMNNYKACKFNKIGEVYQSNTFNFYSL
jgi:hypothetical protein